MSTDLLRYDGSKKNIMTTTAAQTNSAGNIISGGYETAMQGKREEKSVDMAPETKKRTDKKSMEYLIKSGLAGGFAGCAVR